MTDIKKLLNSSTQINILKRALHALALTQRTEQGVNWNSHTLADLLNIEESAYVSERAAATAIDKAKELFSVSIKTCKGARNISSCIEDPEIERELFLFYTNFIISDQVKINCVELINKKHRGKSLWIIARLYFAAVEKKKINLYYNAIHKNTTEEYLIHPYHIVFNKNRFYLVALREKDGLTGLFSLHRIENIKVYNDKYKEDRPDVNEVFYATSTPTGPTDFTKLGDSGFGPSDANGGSIAIRALNKHVISNAAVNYDGKDYLYFTLGCQSDFRDDADGGVCDRDSVVGEVDFSIKVFRQVDQ